MPPSVQYVVTGPRAHITTGHRSGSGSGSWVSQKKESPNSLAPQHARPPGAGWNGWTGQISERVSLFLVAGARVSATNDRGLIAGPRAGSAGSWGGGGPTASKLAAADRACPTTR